MHPQTTYLGGQWIYKTSNAKQRNFDHASLDKRSQYFYEVFEVIHTADELHINNGEAWYCGEPPSFTNRRVFWKSDAIVHRDEKLWIVASATGEDKSRSHLTQLAELTVIRRNSQIEMKGTIWGVADPDGEYAYGFTEIRKISNRPREDAAREAYRILARRSASIHKGSVGLYAYKPRKTGVSRLSIYTSSRCSRDAHYPPLNEEAVPQFKIPTKEAQIPVHDFCLRIVVFWYTNPGAAENSDQRL